MEIKWEGMVRGGLPGMAPAVRGTKMEGHACLRRCSPKRQAGGAVDDIHWDSPAFSVSELAEEQAGRRVGSSCRGQLFRGSFHRVKRRFPVCGGTAERFKKGLRFLPYGKRKRAHFVDWMDQDYFPPFYNCSWNLRGCCGASGLPDILS